MFAAVKVADVAAAGSVTAKSRVIGSKVAASKLTRALVLSPGTVPPPPLSGAAVERLTVTEKGGYPLPFTLAVTPSKTVGDAKPELI
jgi:hypothetical protein